MAQNEIFRMKALFSPERVFVLFFLLFEKVIKLLLLLPLGFKPSSLLNKPNNMQYSTVLNFSSLDNIITS